MGQSVKGTAINNATEAQVDRTHLALRVSLRPPEVGIGGSYSIALVSGVMAAGLAAGSPIVAVRWTSTSLISIVRRIRLTGATDVTAFAQGATIFDLIRATGFTVQDTGGAVISLAGKAQVRASRFPPSQMQIAATAGGNIAIAGTATLVAGTRTLDSNAIAVLIGSVGAVPANFPVPQPGLLWDESSGANKQPLEFLQSEGFVIRATVPATGTWRFGFEMDWDEVDPARYFI